jgi:hypothetical protein
MGWQRIKSQLIRGSEGRRRAHGYKKVDEVHASIEKYSENRPVIRLCNGFSVQFSVRGDGGTEIQVFTEGAERDGLYASCAIGVNAEV